MELPTTLRQSRFHISTKRWRGLKYLLLALPCVAFVLAFNYVPLFGWISAFFNYRPGFRLTDMPFAGFDNFVKLYIRRVEISRILRNTVVMSLLNILASPLPVVFAIMLNEIRNRTFKRFVQTATTLPNFISWIVVFGLSFAIFSSTGPINALRTALHMPSSTTGVLGSSAWVWPFQLGLGVWKSLGWSAIIYIAAIAGIDLDLYDAAKVDGASKLQTILNITVPGLVPTYLVLLLLNISNLLNNGFEQYFVFYNSMVSDRIEVLDYYVYKIGILVNDYSFSIVIGMLKTLVSVALLFAVNRISRRFRNESIV